MFTWEFSIEKQLDYYDDTLKSIKNGFYSKERFYVLPYLPEKFRSRVIFFPQKPDFEKIYLKHKKQIDELEKEWNDIGPEIEKRILKLFPKIDIIISPQLVGSMGSFDIDENMIVVRPRFDRKIGGLVMLIINALTRFVDNNLTWEEKQIKTWENYKKINFDYFLPTNRSLLTMLDKSVAGKLAQESEEYLTKLGIKNKNNYDFSGLILTKNEKKVFDLLLDNKNKLVGLEKIAEIVWEEKVDEKFSLFAISKLVNRLRDKIKVETGRNLIHSQRGGGYVLHI